MDESESEFSPSSVSAWLITIFITDYRTIIIIIIIIIIIVIIIVFIIIDCCYVVDSTSGTCNILMHWLFQCV